MRHAIGGLTRFADDPTAFKTRRYDKQVKSLLIKYMESFEPNSVAGLIDDCRTGEIVFKTNAGYEDGEFIWSTQDIYHLKKYDAAVTDAFIDHVMRQM